MKHKKLPKSKVDSIVGDLHSVLESHNVTQPVKIQFAAAEKGPCFEFRCENDENGNPICHMVEVPCP